MDFDRQKDLREIAEGKHDVCDNADEKAMNETEWQGSYINAEHDRKTLELWEDIWREYQLPWLDAAE